MSQISIDTVLQNINVEIAATEYSFINNQVSTRTNKAYVDGLIKAKEIILNVVKFEETKDANN